MLASIINVLKDCFTRYKGVGTFRYQSDDLNNAQNNFKGFQVYVDDVSRHELNITDSTFTAEFEILIISHLDKGQTVLSVQDFAYTLAATVVETLDLRPEYNGVLRVHDYSILTVSHVTDDDAAGVRLTLALEVPNPALLCDESVWGEPLPEVKEKEIELHTITLPKKKLC